MSNSENICLSCGLCCDGSLIGFVQLDNEEMPALKKLMDIEDVNGNGFFLQPCKSYSDGCTIYSQRPKSCDIFNCELLNSVEQKELDFKIAIEVIDAVKQQKSIIEKQLALLPFELPSQSFYFKIVKLKKILLKKKSESTLTQDHLALLSDINELDNLLSTRFGVTLNERSIITDEIKKSLNKNDR